MATILSYLAFGLRVDSDVALAGLSVRSDSAHAADIVVSRNTDGRIRWSPERATKVKNLAAGSDFGDHPSNGIFRDDSGYLLHLEHDDSYVELHLSDCGRRISWDCSDDIAAGELAVIVEGAFLCGATALQGRQPFHGGCFRVNGRDVAVLADSGTGKSTLLLAMSQQPHVQVMTDDSFSFAESPAGWSLQFGSSALRVSDQAATAFGLDVHALRPLHRMSSKLRYLPNSVPAGLVSPTAEKPTLLCMSREQVSEPSLRPMSQRRAFSQLRHHRHPEWIDSPDRASLAQKMLDFVDSAHIFELVVPDDLDRLPEIASWICEAVPSASRSREMPS